MPEIDFIILRALGSETFREMIYSMWRFLGRIAIEVWGRNLDFELNGTANFSVQMTR